MLILEDLHDADQPSLMMLRFVVGQLKNAPVLILGTYRDIEVQRSPALSQLIGDLTREGTQLPLSALTREDTAQLIEGRAGAPPSLRLVADIHQATAGNPLFIDGLLRVLAAEGSLSEHRPAQPRSLSGSRRGAGSDPPLAGAAFGSIGAGYRRHYRAAI